MASSDKPDFIEIDQKDAPLKLTEGGLSGEGDASEEASSAGSSGMASSAPVSSVADMSAPHSPSQRPPAQNPQPISQPVGAARPQVNDDKIALLKKSMPPGKAMRKLPGGPAVFITILAVVCLFGNQIDEMRNRTLADLAKGFAIGDRGYVETVSDLGSSLTRHHDLDGAKAVYEKALADLAAAGQDSGTRGAFIRLKLAQVAFGRANQETFLGRRTRNRSERQKHYDKSWKYQGEAVPLATQALEMLSKDSSGKPSELPFTLWYVGDSFEDWYDYDMAIKLNEEALNIWGRGSPNRRSYVNTQLAYELLRTGNPAEAEDYVKQALNFSLRSGTCRANAWRYSLLARAQIDQKKYTDGEANISRALEMWTELKKNGSEGNVDVDLGRAYTDRGRIKAALGNTSEALKSFQKASDILKEHPNRTYDNMRLQLETANMYRDIGQFSKARELYDGILSRIDRADDHVAKDVVMREVELFRRLSGGR